MAEMFAEEIEQVVVNLHTAVKEGNVRQLEESLSGGSDCETLDEDLHTPLFLACKEGKVDCVEILMKHKAKLKYEAGGKKFSCLFAAFDANQKEVLIFILSLPKHKWLDGFQFCSEENSISANKEEMTLLQKLSEKATGMFRKKSIVDEEITPVRKLIKKMPDVAKVLFNCLCERSVNDDYIYREVIYDYELLEDYQDLNECHKQDVGSKQGSTKLEKFHDWGPKRYKYCTHPLYLMVRYRRKDLLAHELVSSFICMRWNMFLKYIYYFNLLTYVVLMLLLTTYIHVYFLYAKDYVDLTNQTLTNCSSELELGSCLNEELQVSNCSSNDSDSAYLTGDALESKLRSLKVLLILSSVVISFICLFRLFTEMVQMFSNPKQYFMEFLNYAEVFLYISTILFVANGDFACLAAWRWQLGAFCIFLSWLNFVFFLRLQPNLGIYVIMFEEIITTFLKVLPLAILLILAFGQPFFIILEPIIHPLDPATRPFSNLPYSLMKTLTMMIGEFETDTLLYSVPNILLFPVATYFFWIVFVLVMAVLFQNLLVGLAVDNIKGIQKQAEFKRQVAQIKVLLTLMTPKPSQRLFGFCLRRHAKTGPKEYKKTRGKLHHDKPFITYIKHKSSSLVNFSWKPEDHVGMDIFCTSPGEQEKHHREVQVLDKLERISREIHLLREEIRAKDQQ